VLAGVIVGTVFSSLQTGLFFFADDIGVVQSAIQWTTGSLTGTDWEQVRLVLPWTIVAVLLSIAGSPAEPPPVGRTDREVARDVDREGAVRALRRRRAGGRRQHRGGGDRQLRGTDRPPMVRNLVGSDYKRVIVGCLFVGPALMVMGLT